MRTKQDATKTKIIACIGSGLSHSETAKAVGCSTKTVQRTLQSLEPEMKQFADGLTEYQRLLREQLPVTSRVKIYSQIANKAASNPFAAMRALERIDDLDGILTLKDEARRPSQESGDTSRPLFILPEGTRVNVNLAMPDQAIDITPGTEKKRLHTDQSSNEPEG